MRTPTPDDVSKIADLILTTLGLDPASPMKPDEPFCDDWEDEVTDLEDAIHNAIFNRINFTELTKGN